MKRLTVLLLLAGFCLLSLYAQAQKPLRKQTSMAATTMPYKITYSNLSYGKPEYTAMTLQAWKAYDDNALETIFDMISDTVQAVMPDGSMIQGKENMIKTLKDYRNSFTKAVSTVDATITLKSPDDQHHEVTLVWGTETDTKADGTTSMVNLHEVWFYNKAGKVVRFYQYAVPRKN